MFYSNTKSEKNQSKSHHESYEIKEFYYRMAYHTVWANQKRCSIPSDDVGDLVSEIYLRLQEKNPPFVSYRYCYGALKWVLSKYRREQRRYLQLAQLYGETLPLILCSDEAARSKNAYVAIVSSKELKQEEKDLLIRIYLNEEKMKDIAHTLGQSSLTLYRRVAKSTALLKSELLKS